MHGNPLVVLSAYMPHDASNERNRLAAWEEVSNRIGEITKNNNVVILGNFNAAIHARRTGEEECLGPHIWGKGIRFLRNKEGLLPESMNRSLLIDLLKTYDMRCMNAFFQQKDNQKATYRHVWAAGMQGPWNTERRSELDLCLVFRRWSNSIKEVDSDSLTNIHTDHVALNVRIKSKMKGTRQD